ncbi:MAG: 4Fe-4S dicluster domain-containing protein [Clostridia bacterium]|nr:4Fe-4S dicluster domain-containing protein [Clostridia bacterium]
MNNDLINLIYQLSKTNSKQCMLCGKCSARCPNFDQFDIKPHQFVNLINKGDFDVLFNSKTIHKCLTCLECVERCPRNVAPANLINAIKELAIRQNGEFLSPNSLPNDLEDDMPQQLIVSAFRKFS